MLEMTVRQGETLISLPGGKGMRVIAEPLPMPVDPGMLGDLSELGGMDLWGFIGSNFASLLMACAGFAVLGVIEAKVSPLRNPVLACDVHVRAERLLRVITDRCVRF